MKMMTMARINTSVPTPMYIARPLLSSLGRRTLTSADGRIVDDNLGAAGIYG